jgi:hypothetical protein
MLFSEEAMNNLTYHKMKEKANVHTKLVRALLDNPTVLLAPIIVVIILMTPLAGHFTPVAIWYDRSYDVQSLIGLIGPFVALVGAWKGAQAARSRKHSEVQSIAWSSQVSTWTKTAVWGLLFYLLICAVAFLITATQATWGGPPLGPPLVGAVATLALSALGYTIGDLWSSRLAAPVAGIGVFVLQGWLPSLAPVRETLHYLSPSFAISAAFTVWYHVRPDLVIVQLAFLCGLLFLALASLALRRFITGRKLYPVILSVCGVILVTASVASIANSTFDNHGIRVPLVYNVANDQLIPYTPVCSQAALQVCVHPAYSAELPQLSALVNHLAAPLIGFPGAPIRAEQRAPSAGGGLWHMSGNVLVMDSFAAHAPDWIDQSFMRRVSTEIAIGLVIAPELKAASSGGKRTYISLTPTQQAIALYLLSQANIAPDPSILQPSSQAIVFEQHFAAQPLAARHTWLAQHYTALLQGH